MLVIPRKHEIALHRLAHYAAQALGESDITAQEMLCLAVETGLEPGYDESYYCDALSTFHLGNDTPLFGAYSAWQCHSAAADSTKWLFMANICHIGKSWDTGERIKLLTRYNADPANDNGAAHGGYPLTLSAAERQAIAEFGNRWSLPLGAALAAVLEIGIRHTIKGVELKARESGRHE